MNHIKYRIILQIDEEVRIINENIIKTNIYAFFSCIFPIDITTGAIYHIIWKKMPYFYIGRCKLAYVNRRT